MYDTMKTPIKPTTKGLLDATLDLCLNYLIMIYSFAYILEAADADKGKCNTNNFTSKIFYKYLNN